MPRKDMTRPENRITPPAETPTGPLQVAPGSQRDDPRAPRRAENLSVPITCVLLEGTGYKFKITAPGEHLVGRGNDAQLRLMSPMVSRRQALIVLTPDRLLATIEDLGGANTTMLNGRPMEKATLLDGDELAMGDIRLGVGVDREGETS
jgi:hypothetical protein